MAFHQQTVHPNGIMLGVTGDFDKSEMLALLRETFGDWARNRAEVKIPSGGGV